MFWPQLEPGPRQKAAALPESPDRSEGGLRSPSDRPSASPPSLPAASAPRAPASACRPAGRLSVCSQPGRLITLGNSPKPTQCSPLPFLCAAVLSPHYLFVPLPPSVPARRPSTSSRRGHSHHAGSMLAVGAHDPLFYR